MNAYTDTHSHTEAAAAEAAAMEEAMAAAARKKGKSAAIKPAEAKGMAEARGSGRKGGKDVAKSAKGSKGGDPGSLRRPSTSNTEHSDTAEEALADKVGARP
jgi:hypothetical protein